MGKKFLFAFIFMMLAVPSAWGAGFPMTRTPVTSETLAKALETNDQTVLHVSAEQYVATMKAANPDAGITGVADAAEYIRHLDVRPLDPGKYRFARVEKTKGSNPMVHIDLMRGPRAGENGFYDRNLGRFVASTDCGNVIDGRDKAAKLEPRVPAPPQVVNPPSPPAPPAQEVKGYIPPFPIFAATPPVDFGSAYNDCPRDSSCGQAMDLAGVAVGGLSFMGGMSLLRPAVTNITNTATSAASGGKKVIIRRPHGGPVDPNPSPPGPGQGPTDPR